MICKSDKRDKSASPSSLCWKEHAGSDWTVVWEEREKKEEDEEREDDDDEEREDDDDDERAEDDDGEEREDGDASNDVN